MDERGEDVELSMVLATTSAGDLDEVGASVGGRPGVIHASWSMRTGD